MGVYPAAVWRPLPANTSQARITPRAFIAHSAAGRGSLWGWWMNPASHGLESTWWISFAGLVEQYMDTLVRADANGQANSFANSAETESSIQATERWTPEQAAALVALIVWWCREHNISATLMATPTGHGLAWHVMFGAPGPWTPSRGKTCPGAARIRQFVAEIMPAVQRVLAGHRPPTTPTKPPAQTGALTMSDIKTITDALTHLGAKVDQVLAVAKTAAKPAVALRDSKDGKVWVITEDGRWHVPNRSALNMLILAGQVTPINGEIAKADPSWLDGIRIIDVPDGIAPVSAGQ